MNEEKNTDGRSEWTPPKERRIWPWILLIVVIVGVVINVALTAG
ncbi:hypothetical protein GCM10029978_000890 [Actinoallomurus acanthiterrae]